MTLIVQEIQLFQRIIKAFLVMHKFLEPRTMSPLEPIRTESFENIDFITVQIRTLATHYIRKFCENDAVTRASVLRLLLRNIVVEIREKIWFTLTKTQALKLSLPMDKARCK